MKETSNAWIFTFGAGQPHAGHYVRLHGTKDEARQKMVTLFGDVWAFQYSEDEWREWAGRAYAEGIPVETEMKLTAFHAAKLAVFEGEDAFAEWLCGMMEMVICKIKEDEEIYPCEECPFYKNCRVGHVGTKDFLAGKWENDALKF